MPGRRVGEKAVVLSVYSLGIFSGVASLCCAPVLAGVIALSSVTSSFWLVLIGGSMRWVGLAYSLMPPLADWQAPLAVRLQHVD